MRVLHLACIAACIVLVASQASGQPSLSSFPTKPIHVVVPSPPGGPPDLIIRMLTPKMAGLGQPLVVENRAGAGGIVGTAYVAKTPPDGYTWLVTTASHVNTPPFNTNVPFDPVKDFTHVTLIAQNFGQALTVPASSPFKSVQELIAGAKRNPGKLNYASAGIGTASHIPAEVMKSMSGTDIVLVPYKGVAEAMTDLIAGASTCSSSAPRSPHRRCRQARCACSRSLAAKRWKGLPDVPTMQEAGFKDYNLINWFGLWLPAGAPPEIVARIHAETLKALADPDVRQQFDAQGLEGVGMPSAEFARFVAKESRIDHCSRAEDRQEMSEQPAWQWPEERWRGIVGRVRAGRPLRPKSWPGGARCAVGALVRLRPRDQRAARGRRVDRAALAGPVRQRQGVPRILEILKRQDVKASFFVPAVTALLYPDEQRRVVAEGHEVGIHGWIHERNSELPYANGERLAVRARPTCWKKSRVRGRSASARHPGISARTRSPSRGRWASSTTPRSWPTSTATSSC